MLKTDHFRQLKVGHKKQIRVLVQSGILMECTIVQCIEQSVARTQVCIFLLDIAPVPSTVLNEHLAIGSGGYL